jgi:hypothetical protein
MAPILRNGVLNNPETLSLRPFVAMRIADWERTALQPVRLGRGIFETGIGCRSRESQLHFKDWYHLFARAYSIALSFGWRTVACVWSLLRFN